MVALPQSRPLTLEDFEVIRDVDDGHRYELIDGVLIVTPSPVPVHQRVVTKLWALLAGPAPPGHEVFVAPLDIRLGPDTMVQPDVLVAADSSVSDRRVEGTPLLAVEILSPSTRHIDLGLKLSRYEAAECPDYWVIDPHEESLRAWHLTDQGYELVAHVTGDEAAELSSPWALRVVPSALTRAPSSSG
ncbi:Uma2 family endonuclease [Ornithinimicrobium sp. F0845]|uniref:Uma2 family endonuclease n=1 Tax=Ornithinimicrobium sp. F0845 TaxID=2926412 RepID=UPI001FF1FC12|nr:Uma2 family endonuclease [Ornithinimicrobium sp. F0845]MCK0110674.1 Uma2 family endonuclease [Ornithinimicrobium sp. F0845]